MLSSVSRCLESLMKPKVRILEIYLYNVLKGIPDNANFREGSYNCQDTDI